MSAKKKAGSESKPKAKPKLKIKLQGYDHKVLDKSCEQIIETAERHGVEVTGPVPLPTQTRRYTVNRSTFIHSPSKEQFEMRIHKRLIEVSEPEAEMLDSLRRLSLPAGVSIEIKA